MGSRALGGEMVLASADVIVGYVECLVALANFAESPDMERTDLDPMTKQARDAARAIVERSLAARHEVVIDIHGGVASIPDHRQIPPGVVITIRDFDEPEGMPSDEYNQLVEVDARGDAYVARKHTRSGAVEA